MPTRIITVTLNPAVDCLLEVTRLARGEHQVCRALSRTPGGKGVNVSRVLAKLGLPSTATGFIGRLNRAEFDPLFADGVVSDGFVEVAGAIRQNVTITESASTVQTHLRAQGPAVTPRDARRLQRLVAKLCGRDAIVVISGSAPPGWSLTDTLRLMTNCRRRGARLVVDGDGPTLLMALRAGAWIIKPNAQELGQMLRRRTLKTPELIARAAKVAATGTGVLLSFGGGGAALLGFDDSSLAQASMRGLKVRNTVGCGDVLLGAFVAGMVRGRTPRAALRRAVATASASACHPVAAQFDRRLAMSLYAGTEIRELHPQERANAG